MILVSKLKKSPSVGIFIIALLIAIAGLYQKKSTPFYYQSYFAPALMVACDRSYTDVIAWGNSTAPQKFLNREVLSLKCSDLPPILAENNGIKGGQIWFYLMQYTGYIWKITGIKWWPIDYSAALFAAFSMLFVFKLLKLTTPTNIAFGLTLLFSFYQIGYVSSFRDYSKFPFIFGIIYIISSNLFYKFSDVRKLLTAFGIGCLIAIGYGFRADVGVLMPFCMIYYIFQIDITNWRKFTSTMGMSVFFLTGFGIFFFPQYLLIKEAGTCSFHFALLGLADPFFKSLGLVPAAAYKLINSYNDREVAFLAVSYADRILNIQEVIPICERFYDQVTSNIFLSYFELTPSDFFRKVIVAPLANLGVFILAILLYAPITWKENKKYAILFYFLLIYLSAISVLQHDQRHYFHLMIFPVIASAGILNWLLNTKRVFPSYLKLITSRGVAGMLLFFSLAVMAIDYGFARYQFRELTNYGDTLMSLKAEDLTDSAFSNEQPEIYFKPDNSYFKAGKVYSNLYRITFNTSACKGAVIDLELEYAFNALNPNYDLSRKIELAIDSNEKSRDFFFPVYYQASDQMDTRSYPSKIKIMGQPKSCVTNFYLIEDRSSVPLWMDFSVTRPQPPDQLKSSFW